jgi:glycosyltransferase 2 family protein
VVGRAVGSPWLRAAVVLGVLAFIVARVDWDRAVDRLEAGRWELFGLAVCLLIAALVLGAVRWRVLLWRERSIGTGQLAYAYSVGIFTNVFLPTSFGGDMARSWILSRNAKVPLPRVLASVVADRMLGFGAVFVVGWLGIAAAPGDVPRSMLFALAWATIGAGVVFLVALLLTEDKSGRLRRVIPARAQPPLRELRDAFRGYSRDRRALIAAGALSVAYQALVVAEMWLLARAVGVEVPLAVMAAVLPLVLVATLLPLSIGGLGIREGSIVLLLTQAGVHTSDAAVISLLSLAALTLATGVFALMLIGKPIRDGLPRAGWSAPLQ